ncbi:OsmC family protein [uncultured Pontibacter sp.]|uniref:OsmC family protein n=1 Tax=uncultured Pontibacter sp. TaxID=453356 RepID=UPI0026388067|nr:OsmC family protein [uncultured Pontibacter sp.]
MSVLEVEGFVTVTADSSAPMVAHVTAGSQTMIIDESGVMQGMKPGADPYDFILGALGACTVITLHMYAQRKGWPLEKAEVKLRHDRVHATDCEQCESADAKLSQVTKHLHLYGNLNEEQRKRMEAISARCPVQKTLEAGIAIKTILQGKV